MSEKPNISEESRAYIRAWLDTMPPVVVTPKGHGSVAHYKGEPITANKYAAGTPEHEQWRQGWEARESSP